MAKKSRTAQNFHVRPDQAQQTLAAALRRWLPGKSWTQVQGLIRARHVLVNGNLCVDAGRRLKPAEVVKLLPQPAAPPPRQQDVRIVYLDTHVVVVEKPTGVTTNRHPSEREWPSRRKQLQPTLDEMLPQIVAKLEQSRKPANKAGRAKHRSDAPGSTRRKVRPVHRLDRDTSGLMVFARTIAAESGLGRQFRQHTIQRRYLAVVQGSIPKRRTIESYLARDRGDGRRGSTHDPSRGKHAVTHIKPLEDLGEYTLVECRLETGRTHQIRIHLAEAGHPLCGEKVYQHQPGRPPLKDASGAPRIALHAAELGFHHPISGEAMRFEMPLPLDLQQFLDRLRKGKREHH
jgi:23S rRNA pseudouridine1911/1915/1917 synthase